MWNGKCNGLCSSLQGQRVRESERVTERERERERERAREKASKTWRDYASVIREQLYVGETIETKYLKLCPLIPLWSGGI